SIAGFLAILFAGLLARRIGNWTTGFIALVLLGTWPQFFGQSMNNPKDIPFALGYVMTIYYLVKLVQQLPHPAAMTWIMTTFAIAFTINIRVGGLILVGMLFAFVVGTFILDTSRRKAMGENAGYLAARLALVTVIGFFGGLLFWPFGLLAPLSNPFKALEEMSNFSMPIGLLFDGQMMTSKDIGWNYIPRWLWITTPLVILFAALAYAVVWFFARRKFSPTLSLLLIFATVFPWAYIVYQDSPLYDSLRQLLFILPLIAVLAALTWHYILVSAKQRAVQYALVGLMVVGIILPVRFSIANHPNQYVYFNELIGGIKGAYGKYDTDYYMNSIRETAEWFRQSEMYKNATPQNKILLATNAVDPVNWYFRNDTAKVKIIYTKWNAPGNPKTRGARDWDYGIYFSRDVDPSMLRSGTWPSQKAIYINDADGVPLSVVIERRDKSDLLGHNAFQRKDFSAAEQHLTKAMQYNPQNEEAALLLTQVKLQLNKPREAVHYATQYLQLYPGSPMADQINALIASVGSNQPNMR
ncbi:MAG TPA: tetratricopeptide repeat protein, partial [Chitinophagales bacterium]|nr:tetratricopeptide repeat protein [Chitinophagales bacterium]